VKALTLWQPWATLWVEGPKVYETRSWRTVYRGPLLVHAAKRWSSEQQELTLYGPIARALHERGYSTLHLTRRAAVGLVVLEDCLPTGQLQSVLAEEELAMGEFSPGRWAWQRGAAVALPEPIDMRGHQGLWEVPAGLQKELRRQVVRAGIDPVLFDL
jgi:activating signal cointegrator 1